MINGSLPELERLCIDALDQELLQRFIAMLKGSQGVRAAQVKIVEKETGNREPRIRSHHSRKRSQFALFLFCLSVQFLLLLPAPHVLLHI